MKKETPCIRQGRLTVAYLMRAAEILKMLAHPQRLRMIEILEREQEAPVHVLIEQTGFPQAVVSQHLNQMRRAGLLSARRQGKEMWYSIAESRVLSVLNCICTHCAEGDVE